MREDVETESTIGFMGEALGTAKEAAGRKEAGTAKEGKLILARKEGWYCQGRKLAKKLGYCRRWKLGYCQRWKLRDKEVQTGQGECSLSCQRALTQKQALWGRRRTAGW